MKLANIVISSDELLVLLPVRMVWFSHWHRKANTRPKRV